VGRTGGLDGLQLLLGLLQSLDFLFKENAIQFLIDYFILEARQVASEIGSVLALAEGACSSVQV